MKKQSIVITAIHKKKEEHLAVQDYEVKLRLKKVYRVSDLEQALGRPVDTDRDILEGMFTILLGDLFSGRDPAPIPFPDGCVWDGKKWVDAKKTEASR